MSKKLEDIKQAFKKLARRLRGVIAPQAFSNNYDPIHIAPLPKVVTVQSRERVISLGYRKSKSQQKNWRKWKGKG